MKVAIWGTGSLALKFYYSHKNQYDVVCFFDNDSKKHGNYIDGKPVVQLGEGKNEREIFGKTYILIASTWWKDIAVQLKQMGKKPFIDYMPICFLNPSVRYIDIYELGMAVDFEEMDYALLTDKKIAVIYGNCQTEWLERVFTLYKDFTEDYLIVEIPKVCAYLDFREITDYLMSDDLFWKNVDLFIYQTVRRDNRFGEKVATEGILSRLKFDAVKVNILNVYFAGYFPQITAENDRILHEFHSGGLFPFRDKYIDDMLHLGMSADAIKSEVLREDFISEDEFWTAVRSSMDELVSREEHVDIKITDYIMENYCNEQLFYSNNHPNEELMLEYAGRIMQFLGYDRQEINLTDVYLICNTLKGLDMLLYPSAAKTLGLKRYEKKFYPNRYLLGDLLLDFDGYIDLYIANYKDR